MNRYASGLSVTWLSMTLAAAAAGLPQPVLEILYRLPVTPWLSLVLDLQWVQRPAGEDRAAFVAGLRVVTVF